MTTTQTSGASPKVVAVVGASSSCGAMLLAHLESEWANCSFVTFDALPLRWPVNQVSAYRVDWEDEGEVLHIDNIPEAMQSVAWDILQNSRRAAKADIPDILQMESVDALIHVGSHYDGPNLDQFLKNTGSWVQACRMAGVRRMLYLSDIRVYGIGPGNRVPLTELSGRNPARQHRSLSDAEDDLEQAMTTVTANGMDIAVIRAAMTVGPGSASPAADELLLPAVISKRRHNFPLQFLHEQDLARTVQHAIDHGLNGVYNVASNGIVASGEMLNMCRYPGSSKVPKFVRARGAGRSSLAKHPLIVATTKIKQSAGLRFKYTSEQAARAYCHSYLLQPERNDGF